MATDREQILEALSFRVFARAHPETVLRPENMNDEVAFMVRRVGQ